MNNKRRVKPIVWIALVLIVSIALLGSGAYWHKTFSSWFGFKDNAPHNHDEQGAQNSTKQLWTCGMHPQVIQDKPRTCPICHMKLTPVKAEFPEEKKQTSGERKIKYWWDPMLGPSSISDKPGKSAMGMDLVPVYEDESKESGGFTVTIDPVVVQNMGVRVAKVTLGRVNQTIRAVGYLTEAEPNIHDINLRVSGWLEKLYADTEGEHVKKGEPLFELYSPEVQVAVGELIAARMESASLGASTDKLVRDNVQTLLSSSRRKLLQWGLTENEADRLSKLDQPPRTVIFYSPITGHMIQKNVVEGASVKAGDRVLQIVDHSTLWVDAQVYEQDLSLIKLGEKVTTTFESMPGKTVEGKVIFIHPHLDPSTRTARVRMTLPNPNLTLRPGMYAIAEISAELGDEALLVPREAVIDTGTRQIVFLALGNGRFEPREIKTGLSSSDGMLQVLEGLSRDDTVVTSGQFLLDAESRMKEAIQKHLDRALLVKDNDEKDVEPKETPMTTHRH